MKQSLMRGTLNIQFNKTSHKASFPKGLISKKCETEKNAKNVLKVYFSFNQFKTSFYYKENNLKSGKYNEKNRH